MGYISPKLYIFGLILLLAFSTGIEMMFTGKKFSVKNLGNIAVIILIVTILYLVITI